MVTCLSNVRTLSSSMACVLWTKNWKPVQMTIFAICASSCSCSSLDQEKRSLLRGLSLSTSPSLVSLSVCVTPRQSCHWLFTFHGRNKRNVWKINRICFSLSASYLPNNLRLLFVLDVTSRFPFFMLFTFTRIFRECHRDFFLFLLKLVLFRPSSHFFASRACHRLFFFFGCSFKTKGLKRDACVALQVDARFPFLLFAHLGAFC